MGDATGAGRYRAFISYSHRDAAFGRRLHRRLEGYAMPRRLVGQDTPRGPAPARIAPVFRDLDELPAADDLSVEVRAALADSATLIVVCSPAAAASPWVAREIETFRALHPGRPILAALVAGEPDEAFPEPLRRPDPNGRPVEPLAADFRPGRDGEGLALLKLVAGVTGVRLDELVQRDAQRRLRSVTAVTAVAVTAMLAMAALTTFALQARAEADRQRAEAEGLVEFMQTDLREKLEEVGQLDTMVSANLATLRYYNRQDPRALRPKSLRNRAEILQTLGRDSLARGNNAEAGVRAAEARAITSRLLALNPNDPDALLAHAKTLYVEGAAKYALREYGAAHGPFTEYRSLVGRLLRVEPNNPLFQRELGYSEGNLCALALQEGQGAAALAHCQAAQVAMAKAAAGLPIRPSLRKDVANRYAWLADAQRAVGDNSAALASRRSEEDLIDDLLAESPFDMDLRETWVSNQRALAALDFLRGDRASAQLRLNAALQVADMLVQYDPRNQRWKRVRYAVVSGIEYLKTH